MNQKEYYNKYAKVFKQKRETNPEITTLDELTLAKWTKEYKNKKIIEIGGGIGTNYKYLKECKEYTLTEQSENLIMLARYDLREEEVNIIRMDAKKPKEYMKEQYDIVLAIDIAQHIGLKETIRTANYLLKNEGKIIFREPIKTKVQSLTDFWEQIIPGIKIITQRIENKYQKGLKEEKTIYEKEHPEDEEFTIKEYKKELKRNKFGIKEYTNTWFKIIPIIKMTKTKKKMKINIDLSNKVQQIFPQLKDKGNLLWGIAQKEMIKCT